MTLKIGTRGSALALTQARAVRDELEANGQAVEIVVVKTVGDRDKSSPFAAVGAPGVFVREIEAALRDGRIDVAVHCYKDLPSVPSDDLVIAAMPDRADQRDAFFVREDALDETAGFLPVGKGARVGTASARRVAFVRHERPDVTTGLLRGNVGTRLAKLVAGEHDAIVLAAAGLNRLEAAAARGEVDSPVPAGVVRIDLDPTRFVPAPSQGALALQVRETDVASHAAAAELDRVQDHEIVRAERELLRLVEGGCTVPFGAWCRRADGALELHAAAEADGEHRRATARGDDPLVLAGEVFAALYPERVRE